MAEKSKKGKILIVDDSADIRLLLILKLKKAGYDVLAASNGMEALEVIGDNKDVKLIILDVMMPVMNGIQTMKLLLNRIEKNQRGEGDQAETANEENAEAENVMDSDDDFPLLRVVFCTAKQDPRQIELALQAGADDYITKPIDEVIMIQKIHRLMGQQDEQLFAVLRTQIPITIEEFPDAEPSTLLELSETNAKFECAFQIADGASVTFHSTYLEGFFRHNVKLKGSVIFQEKKGPDLYETDIFFKGLSEQDRQELRSVTTTKRELIKKDNEEGEEGEEGEGEGEEPQE